jgi:hypothetical protein
MTTGGSVRKKKGLDPAVLADLKEKINNDDYLDAAILHIAQVLSNEILGIPEYGSPDARRLQGTGTARQRRLLALI